MDSQLLEWRKEQKEYLSRYYPDQKIKDTDLIFGNPANRDEAISILNVQYNMDKDDRTMWRRIETLCL